MRSAGRAAPTCLLLAPAQSSIGADSLETGNGDPCRFATRGDQRLIFSSIFAMRSAIRMACAATVRAGFKAPDDGKNEASTT
jgi:hypothetical protein